MGERVIFYPVHKQATVIQAFQHAVIYDHLIHPIFFIAGTGLALIEGKVWERSQL